METKIKQVERFLQGGNKIKIEMKLRGREKAHQDFAKEKIKKFIDILNAKIPIKIEKELKKQPWGFTIIISRNTDK